MHNQGDQHHRGKQLLLDQAALCAGLMGAAGRARAQGSERSRQRSSHRLPGTCTCSGWAGNSSISKWAGASPCNKKKRKKKTKQTPTVFCNLTSGPGCAEGNVSNSSLTFRKIPFSTKKRGYTNYIVRALCKQQSLQPPCLSLFFF